MALSLSLLALAACGPSAGDVLEVPADPTPDLQAQHAANLKALDEARQAGELSYPQLKAAWEARNSGSRPMMTASSGGTYVPCAPLPFDGEAQIVGSAGGVFYFGPHRLYVPQGALSAPASIAVMVDPDLKTKVSLLPHGLQFSKAVKLTLAYDHCDTAASHRVAYIDALDNVIEFPNSSDSPDTQSISAWLWHFSAYAIAY